MLRPRPPLHPNPQASPVSPHNFRYITVPRAHILTSSHQYPLVRTRFVYHFYMKKIIIIFRRTTYRPSSHNKIQKISVPSKEEKKSTAISHNNNNKNTSISFCLFLSSSLSSLSIVVRLHCSSMPSYCRARIYCRPAVSYCSSSTTTTIKRTTTTTTTTTTTAIIDFLFFFVLPLLPLPCGRNRPTS